MKTLLPPYKDQQDEQQQKLLQPLSPVSPLAVLTPPRYTRPTRTIAVVGALSTQGASLISSLLDANVQANIEARAYREKQRVELDEDRGRRGLGSSTRPSADGPSLHAHPISPTSDRLRGLPKPRASSTASTDPAEYLHSGWPVAPPSSQSRLYSPALVFDDPDAEAAQGPSLSDGRDSDHSLHRPPPLDGHDRPLSPPDSAKIQQSTSLVDASCIDYLNSQEVESGADAVSTVEELDGPPPWHVRALLRPGEAERDDVFQFRARGVEVCHVDFDFTEVTKVGSAGVHSTDGPVAPRQALEGVWGVFAAPPSRDGFACGSNGSGTGSSFGYAVGHGLRNDENTMAQSSMFPGRSSPLPSADAAAEALQTERRGKALVDAAAEAGVTHFVWSCTGDVRRVNDYLARQHSQNEDAGSDDDSAPPLSSSEIAPSSSPPPSSSGSAFLPLPATQPRSQSQRITPTTSASSGRPNIGPRSASDPTAEAPSSNTPWSEAPPPPLILAHAAVQRHLDEVVASGRIQGSTTLAVALPFEGFSECAWMSFLKAEGGYYCQMPTPTDAPLPFCSAEDTGACALLAFDDPDLYRGLHLDVCSELTSPKELCAQLTQIIYISGKRVLPSPVVLASDFEESRTTTFRRDEETWQTLRWLLSWGQFKMAQRGRRSHMAREGEGVSSASSSPSLDGLAPETAQSAAIARIVHSRLTPWRTFATVAADDLLPGWRESFTPVAARKKLTQLQAPKRSPLSGDATIADSPRDSVEDTGDEGPSSAGFDSLSGARRHSASATTAIPTSNPPSFGSASRFAGMPSSLIGAWSNNSSSYADLSPSRQFDSQRSPAYHSHHFHYQQQSTQAAPPPVPASSALLVSALLTADTSVLPMHADPAGLARRVSAYEFDFDMMNAAAKRAQEQDADGQDSQQSDTPSTSPPPSSSPALVPLPVAGGMGGAPPGATLKPDEIVTAVA